MSTMTLEQIRNCLRAYNIDADEYRGKFFAKSMADAIDAHLRERESANTYFPKVDGISRDGECNKALSIFFARRPTDDEMRAVHDYLNRREAAKASAPESIVRAISLLKDLQTNIGAFRPDDDEDEAQSWDAIDEVCAALEAVAPMLASARVPDNSYPMESALSELIEAIDPSIDSGNILADAKTAVDKMKFKKVAVKEGWQVVPLDPTRGMLDAATNYDSDMIGSYALEFWQTMLNAAPKPEMEG